MSGPVPGASIASQVADCLRATELAVDDASTHLREYADSTDAPMHEAVEVADRIDAITRLLEKIRSDLERIAGQGGAS